MRFSGSLLLPLAPVLVDGEEDPEAASLAWLAGDLKIPAMSLDDVVHYRKAEPSPMAFPLGGEEGLEDSFQRLRTHAAACVLHGELNA